MSQTITGMVAAPLATDTGWAETQILSTITSFVSIQGGAEPTTVNLSFNSLQTTGTVRLLNLPTSSAGLPAGSVWNSSGTLRIV